MGRTCMSGHSPHNSYVWQHKQKEEINTNRYVVLPNELIANDSESSAW